MILNFLCRTKRKENLFEIKRMVFVSGSDILKESKKESFGETEYEIEISSFSGFLYKTIESRNLSEVDLRILGGSKKTEDL